MDERFGMQLRVMRQQKKRKLGMDLPCNAGFVVQDQKTVKHEAWDGGM